VIPWLVLPHHECLALFDLILVDSMDTFPALTKSFDRSAMDNGMIKMPYCDEIDPMHRPMDRPYVIFSTDDEQQSASGGPRRRSVEFVHHAKLSIMYPFYATDGVASPWIPTGPLAKTIDGLTYRKRPIYPRKEPWMVQRDPYSWDVHVQETFDWYHLKYIIEQLHKGCDTITKRKLIVDYMNRFFAIITMEGQVEIVAKLWDSKRQTSHYVRRRWRTSVSG
jgi:hypothetical protein